MCHLQAIIKISVLIQHYSVFCSAILAASNAHFLYFGFKLSLKSILTVEDLKHELFDDVRAFFDSMNTLHEAIN